MVYQPHLDSATPHLATLGLLPHLANINIVIVMTITSH